MPATEVVDRFELVTSDVVAAHESIRNTWVPHRLRIRGSRERFTYRQTTASAGKLAVDSARHTMDVEQTLEPLDFTMVGLVCDGRFRVRRPGEECWVVPGDVLLYPQGVPYTADWEVIALRTVRLPTSEVARVAAAGSGIDAADFRFEGLSPVSPQWRRHWQVTMAYLHSLFAGPSPAVANPLIRAGAVQAVAAAALAAFPNSTTSAAYVRGPGSVTPAAVRRAVAYVDAHAAEPVTLADVVEASGVGARALQEAFRRHLDTTPTGYLRRVRLERAHRELHAADPTRGDSVADIAARWGFHPGRFAAAYRKTYGRSPRQTLLS